MAISINYGIICDYCKTTIKFETYDKLSANIPIPMPTKVNQMGSSHICDDCFKIANAALVDQFYVAK